MADTEMTAQQFLAVRSRLALELDRHKNRSQVNTTALAEALLTAGFVDVPAVIADLAADGVHQGESPGLSAVEAYLRVDPDSE